MNGRAGSRRWAVLRRRVALSVSAVLVGTLLQGVSAPAIADDGKELPGLPSSEEPLTGHTAKARPRTGDGVPTAPEAEPRADWARAGTATVKVPGTGQAPRKAGALPVALTAPSPRTARQKNAPPPAESAAVRVLDRARTAKAGVEGLLFTLTPAAPTGERQAGTVGVGVQVDYAAFAQAHGGAYASRLRLVQLPACSLTTPDNPNCRTGKPVTTTNDTEKHRLTATGLALQAGTATVLAAEAGASSEAGDYTATPLSPSAAWHTNVNTGDFTWSYDIPVPDVPGGMRPILGMSYSSGSIDGRTGTTNNQSSWVGDGFDLWPGSIERRYKPCADDDIKNADGHTPGDLCWGYDNAFISFNGKAGELVPTGNDTFKLQNDDGTKVRRLTEATRGNGDNDNEYWELTTPEGTRYYFGYHRLPGWATGKETTDSTWTAPVYGDDSGDQCHGTTFADSWCQQAWRWNLDYAVDLHGNAVAYYYDKETNSYGRNLKDADDTPYVRGGSLDRIEYGLKATDLYADKALAKVDFDNAERCLPETGVTCAADTIGDKSFYWYDTPWDMNCPAATTCDQGRLSPTFWTRKRLASLTTQVLGSDGTYSAVDSWKLGHRWGMADVDYQLLLESIQHTGHTATPAVTLPKTTLGYSQAANRLDRTGDGKAPFIKERLSDISDEYGGQISVDYSAPACDWNALPVPQTNTTRCFPQYIGGSTSDDPTLQWFNKYVVDAVTLTDRTGTAPDQVTRYTYVGYAAWHFDDDDGLTKEKFKTWSQWRGYGHVRVQTGGVGAMKSQEEHYFLRGMHGDRKAPSGGTKDVSVSLGAGEGEPITDHEAAGGFEYKSAVYSAPGGKVLKKTVSRPWHHETARRTRSWGAITANFTGASNTRVFTSLDNGTGASWRETATSTTYDTVAGRAVEVNDLADTSLTTDDQCTRSTFATSTAKNILTLPSRVETVAAACTATVVDRSKDVISPTRTAYDNGTYGAAPAKGDPTQSATLKEHTGSRATYLENNTTYDAYGRPLKATDLAATVVFDTSGTQVSKTARADGRTTTTAYTPASGRAAQVTVTTPPARTADAASAQTSTTTLDPLRGLPTTKLDTNNLRTDLTYDALGRSLKVWLPNRSKASNHTPNHEFTYTVSESRPVAIGSKTLGKNALQLTTYTLYDGFLRPRQAQIPGPEGGRLVTDTFYDDRGLATKAFAPYYTTGAPQTGLFTLDNALSVETQAWNTYDGLGRLTETTQGAGNGDGLTPLGTTRTVYGGDRTTVIPPVGGTATTSLTDARGKPSELRQHHSRNVAAPYDATRYEHTPAGQLAKVTDPAGNTWTYGYDQLGHNVTSKDPDSGTTVSTYDDRGQLTSTTDTRTAKNKLFYGYDGLGRRTDLREGSATGNLLADWTYDTVSGAEGFLASSTRYSGTAAYTTKVLDYDPLYRATRTSITVPAAEGALQGSYQFNTGYNTDGTVSGIGFPAAGALPGGGVTYSYDDTLRPVGITDSQGLKAVTAYSYTGKPLQTQLTNGAAGKITQVNNTYQRGTQRLETSRVDREDQPGVDKFATYTYDEAGNILGVADVNRTGTDTQCFTYDHLQRLTTEWTQATTACADAPSGSSVGGPAPYWNSYTYDKAGNRLTETRHDLAGDPAQDTGRTYDYPDPGTAQPHTLTSVTSAGPNGTARDSYTYDETGNTRTRTVGGDKQTLEWDAEGHLAKVTEPVEGSADKVTAYLYDAEGQRLIGRTPTETVLYLGPAEITLAKGSTTPKATRYIDLGGGNQAVQSDGGGISFTLGDHHGTGQLAVDSADLSLTRRSTTPFGRARGEEPAGWPGTKGFVGGTTDTSTGLTHLGAREYDASTGRFISVDPIMDPASPQQINGYAYANHSPVTGSDPTGLYCDSCSMGNPDSAWGPGSGPGCTHYNCYDKDGKVAYVVRETAWTPPSAKSSAGRGPKPTSKPVAEPQPIFLAGVRIPTPKEMNYRSGYQDLWGDYQAQVMRWCEGQCHSNPDSEVCAAAHDLGWVRSSGIDLLELIGVRDAIDCAQGSASGCLWTVVGLTPWGKVGKAAKLLKAGKHADAAKLATCAVRHSFVAGTEVAMADGTSKPIEQVEAGDKVLATDPVTGRTQAREVVATITKDDDKHYTRLAVTTTDGEAGITATDHHPFWSPDAQAWVNAGDLTPGTRLLTADGISATVESIRHFRMSGRTYDLTVVGVHTYYVLAGETPVLVHNTNCDVAGRGLWQLTKEGSTKLLKGGPFKTTFHKSASDGTWWTPDVTGHGQSAFKVYRETSKGLEWISDADKYGTYMPDKWKGDTGKFIPMNKLRGVKG
ncbi:sugar-binding protein [Streptomyces finlayi]|uniref:Sugar-binding protein n=1 Tax=Streptomyces finlayi TaxID=67296 RepID=A0A7G7BQC2_9ACTN|nr:polymorphic toxin-type HINT domain-containing protein [Streptomyces finlayi]QNE77537.1 sugar-binding protein [Streptomyces finlayi]